MLEPPSTWGSEERGGSAEEPQQNRRKHEGDLRQCEEDVSYRGITILLTMTPEAHDGHLDEKDLHPHGFYSALAHMKTVHY